MWEKTVPFAVGLYIFSVSYNWLYLGHLSWAGASEALALTGGILIGLSFALSGMTFFFNFIDDKLKYRKELGVLGFFIALGYSVTLAARFPERYIFNLAKHIFDAEVILGLLAMSIFAGMFIISRQFIARRLGGLWRPLLRVGYLATLFLILRAFILEFAGWQLWFAAMDRVPPPRLMITIFSIWVILLRIALELALRMHVKPKPRDVPVTSVATSAHSEKNFQESSHQISSSFNANTNSSKKPITIPSQ